LLCAAQSELEHGTRAEGKKEESLRGKSLERIIEMWEQRRV
jgi:hypothetical protein